MYLCCISSTKMISESDFPLNVSCLCQTMSSSCRVNNNLQYIRTFLEHQNKMDIVYNVFPSFRPFLYRWRNTAKFWVVKNKGEFPLSCHVFTISFRFRCLNVPQNLQQKSSVKQAAFNTFSSAPMNFYFLFMETTAATVHYQEEKLSVMSSC